MATNNARGTKRTCQSNECGARFYDLGRNPIVCPICGTVYALASAPLSAAAEERAARKARKPEFVTEKLPAEAVPGVEADEVLPDIEEADETIAADEDETFLEEEEEEGGDVSNILGGPVAEGDEER
ncbi:MAG: TIGR02300 family protein [Hyphomicrobium sp.]|jgi:uncharacterized protein (TIGR02300 family)